MDNDDQPGCAIAPQIATLPGLLKDASSGPDASYLLCPDRDWTYSEFSHAVDELAMGLVATGIRQGDRIAIAAPNSAQWLITWFAVTKIGAILVTLNVAYREREFDYMLNQSGAVMLVCSKQDGEFDFVDFVQNLRQRIPTVRHYVFLGEGGFAGSHRWEDLLLPGAVADLADFEAVVEPDDPAVILYTSGTTGDPKGATLTHASILASASAQAEHLSLSCDDVAIGHMPFNHVGGMTCTVAATMLTHGRIVVLPRYSPKLALEAVDLRKVTIFIGVPTMYTMMMDLPEFPAADITSVRTCIIGGSNVEPAMGRRILDTFQGARLSNLYGLSETSGGCIISAANDDLDTLVETLGVAIGDFEIRIAGDAHQPLPFGQQGELHIRGGCVASGYWENPMESERAFLPGGWLVSGDMAVQRPDGRIELCGRRKEMYVRSGYNVYPVEIENVIAADPAVAMCAVVGVPDAIYGEVGHAYIVATQNGDVNIEAVRARCGEKLARYKIPAQFHVVDSLPLTPSGKIKKVALLDAVRGKIAL
ncbi:MULTISPECIES: class I adenylate-forming enzyme family protein [Rhodococcus]|jgi:acyl-CoA synthetase (AMP-forming)/AMP-acid ligase II|uniref:class I adenylate-forming enzyme family protein n=1 Tax=Rhodococcus TaxID=1827 RepID=UPI00031968D8|nr:MULTISPECIES: class I adenylate-forming enzyme family protein [Rhodococcus]OQM78115.1 Long-chain-fatty-acid--CoA ligase [Rhodococcus sp. 66b]